MKLMKKFITLFITKKFLWLQENMDETLIVTYSPKYKAYQRRIRDRQIERAEKIINTPGRKRKGKNQNDPMRFVKKTP